MDTYECSSTAATKTIAIGAPLQAGDVVLAVFIASDDLGTSPTVSVGDAASPTRYVSALDINSAAKSNFSCLVDGCGYIIGTSTSTDDTQILATINTDSATGTIKFIIMYGRN